MERVTGIGGFFFRSGDPGGLAVWYQERMGIKTTPESYDEGTRPERGGPAGRRGRLVVRRTLPDAPAAAGSSSRAP